MCYYPLSEIATLILKGAIAVPVKAWGTISTAVFRADSALPNDHLNCTECTIKFLPDEDIFAINWGHKVNHIEFCSALGCENLNVFENTTGLRRRFGSNTKIPRFVRAQWWWDGVFMKSEDLVCPYPNPCRKIDCYLCKKFAELPECHPFTAVVITIVSVYFAV